MSQTAQLRFANAYARATRDLRLQIDGAFSVYHRQSDVLGVVSLVGVDLVGIRSTVNIALHPDFFSIAEFATAVETFQSIELCILLVRAENVYPPMTALELLAKTNAKCEVIRVSAADMSFEFRPLGRLIDFAAAQSTRCGSCSRSATCSASTFASNLQPHIVVHAIPSEGRRASA